MKFRLYIGVSILLLSMVAAVNPLRSYGQESVAPSGGAISVIDPEYIAKYPDLNISAAFQGQAAGLIVRCTGGGLGTNGASFFVRGQHAGGTAAIVMIDGMERSLDDISAEEIGSIEVLMDASAKILYGPRATNGVVLINTRRGLSGERIIRASLEYGVSPSTRVPEYLGAYEYASLFNEARLNDGLTARYSASQLDGYRNSKGENDVLYPNVDWYGRFAGGMKDYKKAVAEFIGGGSAMKYSLVTTFTSGKGLESVGKPSGMDRLNIRGNLDIDINDFIKARADVAARIELKSWGQVNQSTLFSRISTLRPNEYPLTIDPDYLGLSANSNGIPFFGGSSDNKQNLLDDMGYGGSSAERYIMSQTNLGLLFDLGRFVPGLSADAYITFDNYSYVNQTMTKYHPTYAVEAYLDEYGTETYSAFQIRKLNESDDISIGDDRTKRTIGANGSLSWKRSFGKQLISTSLLMRYYRDTGYGYNQDCITSNAAANFKWAYDSRLFAELTLGTMTSNQPAPSQRTLFTPALSLGYIISSEPFVKLKASAGRLGYDPDSNYLLYNTTWVYPGDYAVGPTGDGVAYKAALSTLGNPRLGWITSTEANAGIELLLSGGRLGVNADIFTELREGGIAKMSGTYSAVAGDFLSSKNYTSVRNNGADLALSWADRSSGGDFSYRAALNLTITRNKIVQANETPLTEAYRTSIGRPTSAIIALQHEGLFGKDIPIDSHAAQTFGRYTDGDIAYKDMNEDGVIDSRDEKYLGQTFPLASWGLTLDIRYKGFGFYALGTAEHGASVMLSNSYYWNTGVASYSVLARDRYHATANPGGTLPRLTTTSGANSYRDSSFWLKDASFFRLKNVELSWTMKGGSVCKDYKFFLRGTNLFVISAIKDLDPEVPDAGVTNYPVYRTLTGGVSVSF